MNYYFLDGLFGLYHAPHHIPSATGPLFWFVRDFKWWDVSFSRRSWASRVLEGLDCVEFA